MGLRVNFSQNEAESTAREIIPSGAYLVNVVEVKTSEVKPGGPNTGKPYWNIRFVVQEGKYAGNSVFSNIMLFSTDKDGTLSTLAQFLKAVGYAIQPGDFDLPDESDLEGKSLVVVGRKLLAGYDKKAGKELPDRFRIDGYKKATADLQKATSGSILP